MTLGVGDEGERHSRDGDGLLHDAATEPGRVGDGVGHVVDAHEERDEITVALQRADGRVERARDAGLDEGVAGEGSFVGIGSSEQVAEEGAGGVGVARADLGVDDGVTHDDLRGLTITGR